MFISVAKATPAVAQPDSSIHFSLSFSSGLAGDAVGAGAVVVVGLGVAVGAWVAEGDGAAVIASPGLAFLFSGSVVQAAKASDMASRINVFLSIVIHAP